MASTITSNMGLILPSVSSSTSIGTYAQNWSGNINYNMFLFDSHNHTSNNGVQIASSDLTISNLNLSDHSIYELYYLGLTNLSSSADIDNLSLYVLSNNLYYKDSSGNEVQITSGNSLVPITVSNGFFGDYMTSAASAVYYSDSNAFYFYGNSSTGLADINCSDISNSSLAVSNLAYSITLDLAGYFPNAGNSCPDNTTGGWQNCFYSTSQSGFGYPYAAITDSYGGLTVPGILTDAGLRYTDVSFGFFNYHNDTASKSPYLDTVIFLNEGVSTDNGWTLSGNNTSGWVATKSVSIGSSYTRTSSYSTINLLSTECVCTFEKQTTSSGTYWQIFNPNSALFTLTYSLTDGETVINIELSVQQTTGSLSTIGYVSSGVLNCYVSTYGTYYPLTAVIYGLVRKLL